jgi:branched-chain amino acid transport system ATP-binding protein
MSFLELDQIDVYISNLQILEKVSLKIEEGEITSIIGANGAGKSTLLNAISGVKDVKAGEIRFQGKVLEASPRKIVEHGIIQVPEGRHLFPYMTVLENLEIGAYLAEAKERRAESMKMVFHLFPILDERKKQLAKSLSGGEQQMLAVGRALMARPRLLMLDEPTLGLAPIMVKTIFETLQRINREGTTVLLVEQDAKKSLEISSRGYVLENGKMTLEGDAKTLLENPYIKKAYLGI